MVLEVVKYGHPALRKKGARVEAVTTAIKELIANMFDTMYAARGIGLAAQQVGQALQITVIDVREASAERPSTLEIKGQPADVHAFMPLVLINPSVTPVGEPVTGAEGCLSFPEMYADILRPGAVDVVAMNDEGKRLEGWNSAAKAFWRGPSSTRWIISTASSSLTAWIRTPRDP
jgi:peptide deformylase